MRLCDRLCCCYFRMIEEFMLLANMTVARRLIDAFPVGAMLRRHPPPRTPVLEDLVTIAASDKSMDKCLVQ